MTVATPSDDPIFVVGAGRSGTTLLQALIGAHPRIAAPPEVHFVLRVSVLHEYWGDLNDDDVLRRVIEATLDIPALSTCGFDLDRVWERARGGPRTYGGVLDAVMRDFTEREGKQRWSEKSPMQGAQYVWQLFPEAQVVHIVRDPRDTIASNLKKTGAWQDPTTAGYEWRRFTTRSMAAGEEQGPERYLRIRYEDLVHKTEPVMRQVFDFLREEFDPAIITDRDRRLATVRSATASRLTSQVLEPIAAEPTVSRNLVSWHARMRIEAAVAPTLPVLGYDRAARTSVAGGHLLNVAYRPRVWVRRKRREWGRRLRSPAARFRARQREQRREIERLRQQNRRARG